MKSTFKMVALASNVANREAESKRVILYVFSPSNVKPSLVKVMVVERTSFTVMVTLSLYSAAADLTVIVTCPAFRKVTTPFWETVATEESEVDQMTPLFVALEGDMVAERVWVDFT